MIVGTIVGTVDGVFDGRSNGTVAKSEVRALFPVLNLLENRAAFLLLLSPYQPNNEDRCRDAACNDQQSKQATQVEEERWVLERLTFLAENLAEEGLKLVCSSSVIM